MKPHIISLFPYIYQSEVSDVSTSIKELQKLFV